MKEQNYSEKNELLFQSKENEEQKEDLQYIIERNIKNETYYDKSIKIILLGDSNVGKSSIINRLCKGKFKEIIGATISIECHNYLIKINDYTIRMKIWDTVGQEKFNSIVTNYYHSTDYAIFVYSIDDFQSFYSIKDWLKEAQQKNTETFNEMKYILLGNKKDLEETNRIVTYDDGKRFAENNRFMSFKEISCKNDDEENILKVFDEIAIDYYTFKNRLISESDSLAYLATDTILEMSVKGKKEKKCC